MAWRQDWAAGLAEHGVVPDDALLDAVADAELTSKEFHVLRKHAATPALLAYWIRTGRHAINAALAQVIAKQTREEAARPKPVAHSPPPALPWCKKHGHVGECYMCAAEVAAGAP